jgi:hypothetical protein
MAGAVCLFTVHSCALDMVEALESWDARIDFVPPGLCLMIGIANCRQWWGCSCRW